MSGDTISRYWDENMRDLKKSKPSKPALEQARFFMSVFKQFKLQQQG
jgi:hypothetical protein